MLAYLTTQLVDAAQYAEPSVMVEAIDWGKWAKRVGWAILAIFAAVFLLGMWAGFVLGKKWGAHRVHEEYEDRAEQRQEDSQSDLT